VVIATVFLTIIGMTGGFVLGERHRRLVAAVESPGTTQPAPTPTTGPTPTQSRSAATSSAQATSVRGGLCPELIRKTSESLGFSSTLRQVMRIETDNGTTVWICQDDTGGYYYQSKTGGLDAALEQGKNGLFLFNVHHAEDREEYVALATDGTRFIANRKQLEVDKPNGSVQKNLVVKSE
jgi:hypothetical protein